MSKYDQFVTLKRAAELLEVTPDTLRQQIHNGAMTAEKMGHDWFVTMAEVERYAIEHQRERRQNDNL